MDFGIEKILDAKLPLMHYWSDFSGLVLSIIAVFLKEKISSLKNTQITNFYLMCLYPSNVGFIILDIYLSVGIVKDWNVKTSTMMIILENTFHCEVFLTLMILFLQWLLVVFRYYDLNREQTIRTIVASWLWSLFIGFMSYEVNWDHYLEMFYILFSLLVLIHLIDTLKSVVPILLGMTIVFHVVILWKLQRNIKTNPCARNMELKNTSLLLLALTIIRFFSFDFWLLMDHYAPHYSVLETKYWGWKCLDIFSHAGFMLNPITYILWSKRQTQKLSEFSNLRNSPEQNQFTLQRLDPQNLEALQYK